MAVSESGMTSSHFTGGKGLCSGQCKKLTKIEDLKSVPTGFRSNVCVAIDDLDIAPDGADSGCWKASPIFEAAVG